LTGAGISAESGLATFRGPGGWWRKYDPQTLATPQAFRNDPGLVWEWYWWRREKALKARPNPGHLAIAALEGLFPRFLLITQNVDGLHQRAGSRIMVELHGNILRERCLECGRPGPGPSLKPEGLPRCDCGGLMRPDVVWFGEPLPSEGLELAWRESARADLFLAVGTSGLVQPAASLPLAAGRKGAFLAEVNPEPTPLSDSAGAAVRAKAGQAMPAFLEALRSRKQERIHD
jgi:NAD-dependent deacetylase